MRKSIIDWESFKESKTHMIAAFVIGFFSIVGASEFLGAVINFLF